MDEPQADLEKRCATMRVEKKGFVAVGKPYEGSQRYIDVKQGDNTAPTTRIYGDRP